MKVPKKAGEVISPHKAFIGAIVPLWLMRREVSPGARLCYGRLCMFAGKKRYAFPTMQTLADALAVSKRQATNYVNELKKLKLIYVESRKTQRKSSRFWFQKHAWMEQVNDLSCVQVKDPSHVQVKDISCVQVKDISCPTGKILPNQVKDISYDTGNIFPTEETHRRDSGEETQGRDSISAEADASTHTSPPFTAMPPPTPSPNAFGETPPTTQCVEPEAEYNARIDATYPGTSLPPGTKLELVKWLSMSELISHIGEAHGATKELVMDAAKLKQLEEEAKARVVALKRQDAERRMQRQRQAEGTSFEETPPKPKKAKAKSGVSWECLKAVEATWNEEFSKKFPEAPLAKSWAGKEGAQAKMLLQKYELEDVKRAIRYLIKFWHLHQPKLCKGDVMYPTLGLLLGCSAQMIPEARAMSKAFAIKKRVDQFYAENNGALVPMPEDLKQLYEAAKPMLKKFETMKK